LIATSYYQTYDSPVTITRCGNFFGGGDLNWNRIVPGTIRSVLRDQAPVIRSDGTPKRDYIYVEDAANAYLLLAEATASNPELHGEAFNFSCEEPRTVLEVVNEILRVANRPDLQPTVLAEAPNEIHDQYLSASKARARLGWKPLFSFEEALQLSIDWYTSFFAQSPDETPIAS
jgi:CDP-glucose 4,6-dehydratase